LRRLLDYVGTWLGLLFFAVLIMSGAIGLMISYWIIPKRFRRVFGQMTISWLFRTYMRVMSFFRCIRFDMSGMEALRHQGAVIVAPNHPSLLDAVMLLSVMPRGVCIMKPALMNNFMYGFGARMAGYIPADNILRMIGQFHLALGRGEQILYFPEGTRSLMAPVNPMSPAFCLMARRSGVPLQLVRIETQSEFLGKFWPLWKAPKLPVRYRVRLGPQINPQECGRNLDEVLEDYYAKNLTECPTYQHACANTSRTHPIV
jgi:1-acyl-sn-glycerol-3-phosphate acyltransferase